MTMIDHIVIGTLLIIGYVITLWLIITEIRQKDKGK
jgi:hypothetical protein